MKRPLAYLTAAWSGEPDVDMELAAHYCRLAYEAGYSPICPLLYLPLFLNDSVPEEHKAGIDIGQNVQQDLVQPQRVGDDILVLHIHGINKKRQPLCRNIGLNDGAHIVDEVRQMHRFFLDLYLSALDAAHIQHIIDE